MYVCLVAMTFLMEEEGGILRCHGREGAWGCYYTVSVSVQSWFLAS